MLPSSASGHPNSRRIQGRRSSHAPSASSSAALHGPDTIGALTAPGGRLYETRRALIDCCAQSEHLDLVAPSGALYGFPAVVGAAAKGFDDHAFALEMLETQDVLIVPGSSFNVPERNYFRVTLLPEAPVLREVFARIDRVLAQRADAAAPDAAAPDAVVQRIAVA